jgi:phosphatidate cytidylyltransferase
VDVGATLLGVVYVPFLASFALVMLRVEPAEVGRNLLLAVVGLTILYDILAYAVGSMWGDRALAPTVSPSKSWEGAGGATLLILLVAISLVPSIEPFTPTTSVGLALIVAIFAPIGDLVESAFKRDLGVKDMSSILPGHGGILDRIDSILFTAPAAWYFFRLVILGG